MSYLARPHLRFPFQRVGGRVNVVEQDDPEHVMSCNLVIVRCPLGFRDDRPEFGWPWPELGNAPIDLGPLRQALEQFEPRNERLDMTQFYDAINAAIRVQVDAAIESEDASE